MVRQGETDHPGTDSQAPGNEKTGLVATAGDPGGKEGDTDQERQGRPESVHVVPGERSQGKQGEEGPQEDRHGTGKHQPRVPGPADDEGDEKGHAGEEGKGRPQLAEVGKSEAELVEGEPQAQKDEYQADGEPPTPRPELGLLGGAVRNHVILTTKGKRGVFRSASSGFSLIEVLVALAIATLALLLSLSLLWQQPRLLERLEARRASQRVLEATMETLRAGGIPLVGGTVEWRVPAPELPTDLTLRLMVSQTGDADVRHVELEATWMVQHRRFHQELHTLVWTPP